MLSIIILAIVAVAFFFIFYPVFEGNTNAATGLADNIFYVATAFFLIVFGIIFTCVSCACLLFDIKAARLIFAGMLSLTVGLWTICSTGVIQLISYDAKYNSIIEFEAEYAVPTLLMLFMQSLTEKKYRKLCFIPTACAVAFMVIANIAYFYVGVETNSFHGIAMLLNAFESVFTIYILFRMLNGRLQIVLTDKVMMAGVFCYACTLIIYAVIYFISEFVMGIHIVQAYRLISIGALIFVTGLIANYQLFIVDNRRKKREKDELLNIAYVDTLTKICNRTRLDKEIRELAKEENYAIISFDLNDLKEVNDKYGHNMGDKLIKGFATIMDKCFGDRGIVGRMGGDEFLAVVNGMGRSNIDSRLLTMEALLAAERKKDTRLPFSVSYGYVMSIDYPGMSALELCKIADKKMYEMKSRVKHSAVRK